MYKLVALFLCFAAAASAGSYKIFDEANTAYRNKEYRKAAELYGNLHSASPDDPVVLYNLGNAWFRAGELGLAVLAYEKAIKIAPADDDTRHNLAVVNARLQDKIEPLPGIFLFRWWGSFIMLFSVNTWLRIAALMVWCSALVGISLFFSIKTSLRRLALLGIPACIILLLLSLVAVMGRLSEENGRNEAIVIEKSLNVRSAPDASSRDAFIVHEGLKVRVTDALEDWVNILLPDGKAGWVKKSSIGMI